VGGWVALLGLFSGLGGEGLILSFLWIRKGPRWTRGGAFRLVELSFERLTLFMPSSIWKPHSRPPLRPRAAACPLSPAFRVLCSLCKDAARKSKGLEPRALATPFRCE
jgi:hypothetical protein